VILWIVLDIITHMNWLKLIFVLTILVTGATAAVARYGILMASPEAIVNANPRSSAEIYSKYCASCHGKDGRAKTVKAKFNHARDISDRTWHDNVSDERIFNSIMNGKGKNMPAYSKKLSEQEIDALVGYVRLLKR
jgi:mono/diheme cytochrome c family protein